jgi:hypothetical protein
LPDAARRKAWLSSPEMYRFWCDLKSAPQAGIVRTLAQAARRKLFRKNAATIPDLFNDYLFELPQQLPLPQAESSNQEVAIAIIGGKLLFSEAETGQPRGQRKLFAETVFCDPRSAALLQGMHSPLSDHRWGRHAISEELMIDMGTPLSVAARISIVDMFYFRCFQQGSDHYIGGVLDLFPIEVARRLADQVVMEFKSAFDQKFAIPAWRSVLGVEGNLRLRYVNGQFADFRIDTSDISSALSRESIRKSLDWKNNRVQLVMPDNYETYVQYMDAQWQYGYLRGLEAFDRAASRNEITYRQVGRHNQGCE